MSNEILAEFRSSDVSMALVFEDNGRVAYAYLLCEGGIIGDVWLYNRGPVPEEPEWTSPEKMPFANCSEYVSMQEFEMPTNADQLSVDWESDDDGACAAVKLFIDRRLHAVIAPGDKPGACRLAAKDGPLAKVLKE